MADEFGEYLVAVLPRLRRFAISLCKSRDVADELVQTTCEKAILSRESFTPGTNMDAWLFRILRNTWIDRVRKLKTEGISVDIADAQGLIGHDGGADSERRLMLKSVAAAIAALPDDQREVLVLACVEEMTYREVADTLNLPVGTVMSRLARARQKIGQAVGINPAPSRSHSSKEEAE